MTFRIIELDKKAQEEFRINGTWDDSCPIDISRLSIAQVLYLNFQRKLEMGKLLVFDLVSENVIKIFEALLEAEFPINSIKLLDYCGFDDLKSMDSNNSSSFNNRKIAGSDQFSIHAYGLAIDINPRQNPMVCFDNEMENYRPAKIYPSNSAVYLNRALLKEGMVEPVVDIFYKNGFNIWGGLWADPLDYHHFQVPREIAEKLAMADKKTGEKIWHNHLQDLS